MSAVTVIGGTGFIGRALVQKLQTMGVQCFAVGRTAAGENQADLETAAVPLRARSPAYVFVAGNPRVDVFVTSPEQAISTYLRIVVTTLEAIRDTTGARRLILVSSDRVYGRASGRITERTLPRPADPYGSSRLAAEALGRGYAGTWRFGLDVVRATTVYGPGQAPGLLLPSLTYRLAAGERELTTGALDATRQFLFVDDLADLIARMLQKPPSGRVFHAAGEAVGVRDAVGVLLSEFERLTGERAEVRPRDHPNIPVPEVHRRLVTFRAKRAYGWESQTPFVTGIRRTLERALSQRPGSKGP